jgi:hypothetical protein
MSGKDAGFAVGERTQGRARRKRRSCASGSNPAHRGPGAPTGRSPGGTSGLEIRQVVVPERDRVNSRGGGLVRKFAELRSAGVTGRISSRRQAGLCPTTRRRAGRGGDARVWSGNLSAAPPTLTLPLKGGGNSSVQMSPTFPDRRRWQDGRRKESDGIDRRAHCSSLPP